MYIHMLHIKFKCQNAVIFSVIWKVDICTVNKVKKYTVTMADKKGGILNQKGTPEKWRDIQSQGPFYAAYRCTVVLL